MALDIAEAYSPRVAEREIPKLVHPVWLSERHRKSSAKRWLRDPSNLGLYRISLEACDHSSTRGALYRFYFNNIYTAVNFKLMWG